MVKTYPKKITTSSFHGVARKEVILDYLPRPDFLQNQLPDTHLVLVTNDGSDLTAQVVQQLKAQEHQVVVLNLAGITSSYTGTQVQVASNTDAAIAEAVQQVQAQHGQIGNFIHLHPHFTFQGGNFTQHFQQERELLKAVFLLAKHLQVPLNSLGESGQARAAFMTITRLDGQLGMGKRSNTSIVGGGLNGLVKCLNLEWSSVYCRAVDIAPELSAVSIAEHIVAELHDPNRIVAETAVHNSGRYTLAAKAVAVEEGAEIETSVTEDSVFLVSGGARGVTANCVIELAKTFQCKFILLGRSDNDVVIPAYANEAKDEADLKRLIMMDLKAKGEKPNLAVVKQQFKAIVAKQEIEDTLSKIRAYGGQATYLQGDVTKLATVKAPLQAITTEYGRITGIIHGAGRLADKYIQDKAEQDFLNVLTVKLDGLLTLLQCVDIHNLDHLILFSSVAGFYGNVGQTDYAIANEILSKAAHLFRTNHPNTQVSAINWGAWDSGMVSDALKKKFEAMGVTLVSSEGGPAMLVNELSLAYQEQPQVIIGGTLPAGISHTDGPLQTHKIQRQLNLEANPFLNHHVIQGNAVLPVVNAVSWMSSGCEQLFPDYRVFQVEQAQLFKGIVFDGNQPKDYTLVLEESSKDQEKIHLRATVLSQSATAKLPTYHYKANIVLVKKDADIVLPNFQANLSGTYTPSKGDVLYTNGMLFHDDYFRGIEQILDWTEDQIVLRCKAPEVPLAAQGQFPVLGVNTFFADIQYQGMVIWVQRYHDGAKSLPLSTKLGTVYRPVPFGQEFLVHIAVEEKSDFKMTATCTVYDESGQVYMKTESAAVTVSKELEW